jgi:hypothetical protein
VWLGSLRGRAIATFDLPAEPAAAG